MVITRLLNHFRNKVEGHRKGVPCLREKLLCCSELTYWKLREKEGLKQTINKETMASKKSIARVVENTSMIDEIDAELEKAQGKWICLKGRRYQARKECLLDFRDAKITGDEVRDARVEKKVIKRVHKEKNTELI